MTAPIKFQAKVHFHTGRNGRKQLRTGKSPAGQVQPGRVPRVSRLMALAVRLQGLIGQGTVASQAELARLGHVSRARVTQIMNLLCLAPDIQEELLFLPRVRRGRDPIRERDVRPIALEPDWKEQRKLWYALKSRAGQSK